MDQAPLNAQQKCLALNKCYYYYYYYYSVPRIYKALHSLDAPYAEYLKRMLTKQQVTMQVTPFRQ